MRVSRRSLKTRVTGYTSIGRLARLPVDIIKIDRSFVPSDGPGQRELVRLIVEAAHAFELSVVAEGIETLQQARQMRLLSVDAGQGYYFARPAPAATAARLAVLRSLPEGVVPSTVAS